ncbi:hypothetical protein N7494_005351 [Penicillium frequentans]|uniref:Uncharacterized protein n=1 Tax=Penicillium frequentans TaxID=3151616 RepID=A0AAD6CY16_9EURO|nr:hypothetical protein N7494_005351 [Penicillium glabrum]
MAKWKDQPPDVQLTLRDTKGNEMKGRFLLTETPSSLRLSWLQTAMGISQQEAIKKVDHIHISMIERLGSLGDIILDIENQTLKCIPGLQNEDILIALWHWVGDCDGSCPIESMRTPLAKKAKSWVPQAISK